MGNITDWHANAFLPWLEKARQVTDARAELQSKLRDNLPQLQTMWGMVMAGKTRQAVLVWNNLGIYPLLRDITLSPDGETVTLMDQSGTSTTLRVNDLRAALEGMVAE